MSNTTFLETLHGWKIDCQKKIIQQLISLQWNEESTLSLVQITLCASFCVKNNNYFDKPIMMIPLNVHYSLENQYVKVTVSCVIKFRRHKCQFWPLPCWLVESLHLFFTETLLVFFPTNLCHWFHWSSCRFLLFESRLHISTSSLSFFGDHLSFIYWIIKNIFFYFYPIPKVFLKMR